MPDLFKCAECEYSAESKYMLNEHVENVHSSDFWMVGPKRRKKNTENEVNQSLKN